jgi:AcrR family transcriptional regulator
MESESPAPITPRPRGRRLKSAAQDTRGAIIVAAGAEFASRGYESASMRSIARRAGVDPALVHHYFQDKADLFAESISAPIRPDRIVKEILAGPREKIGENIIRYLLSALDDAAARTRMISLLHTALGQEFAATMLRQFLAREVLRRIADTIGGPDAELRASLAASQIVGLIVVRFGVRIEPLASAPVDVVVAMVGPVIQWHLVGDGPLGRGGIDKASRDSEPLDSSGPAGE